MNLPRMGIVRQNSPTGSCLDIETSVSQELQRTGLLDAIKPGDNVLITAGSRGIECMVAPPP